MKRENADRLLSGAKVVSKSDFAVIYKTSDGRAFKHFTPMRLYYGASKKLNFDKKIDYADKIEGFDELYKATSAVYKAGHFCGYVSAFNHGVSLKQYYDVIKNSPQKDDLYFYKKIFEKLSNIVKRANELGIVIPKLCTCEDIFVDVNGDLSLINYDGLQIGEFRAYQMSVLLGDEKKYNFPKFYDEKTKLYTPEIDKVSLLMMYFKYVLNVELAKVGTTDENGIIIDLDYILNFIGLNDHDICNMIRKTLDLTSNGYYIGDIVGLIADRYYAVSHPREDNPKILIPRNK